MIVVEERLIEIFNQLPQVAGFKPKYHFGDDIELGRFIKAKQGLVYPLIYQTSANETQLANENRVRVDNLTFFIAVRNEKVSMFNTERWATSYRNILMPTLSNVITAFQKSNIMASNYEFDVVKFPNYGAQPTNSTQNKTIDIIDAIQVSVDVVITDNCITKNIKF